MPCETISQEATHEAIWNRIRLTDEIELCLLVLELRFEREKEDVKVESMPIVLDFESAGGPGEIGRRRRFVGAGCMFCVCEYVLQAILRWDLTSLF